LSILFLFFREKSGIELGHSQTHRRGSIHQTLFPVFVLELMNQIAAVGLKKMSLQLDDKFKIDTIGFEN